MGIAMMAMLCFTFSSCGDDDDEKGGGNSNSNTSNGLSGYYTFVDYFANDVKNNQFYDNGQIAMGCVFFHIIDNNTIERGMITAYKYPQSNAVCTKNIEGTTLYFVVDYLDWVCKYTYSDGALYISNGDIYTIYNGKIYTSDNGQGLQKL